MGQVLYDYYQKVEQMAGLPAKMYFAGLTKVASTQAKSLQDSPEMIELFDKCLSKLKVDFKIKEEVVQEVQPTLLKKKVGESLESTVKRLRMNSSIYLDLMSQRSLFIGDLQQTFSRITEASVEALNNERVSIWFFNEARTQIICQDLFVKKEAKHSNGMALNAADFPNYFSSIKSERTLAAHDAHKDPRTSEFSELFFIN